MIRYFTLLLFIGLVFWGCEDAEESLPYLDLEWIQYEEEPYNIIQYDTTEFNIDSFWSYDTTYNVIYGYTYMIIDSVLVYDTTLTIDSELVYDTTLTIDSFWVDISKSFSFYLNSASENVPTSDEEYASKYIHYYMDELYFEYDLTNETDKLSKDISDFTNIIYEEK